MSALAVQLRDAADVAERAAVARQHGPSIDLSTDTTVIGGLQFAAESLSHAAGLLDSPQVPHRAMIEAGVQSAAWVISCAVVLLVVPDPSRPSVLAVTVGGGAVLAMLAGVAVSAVSDRCSLRAVAPAELDRPIPTTVDDLRVRLAACTTLLEVHRGGVPVEVGRWIAHATTWVDVVNNAVRPT